MDGSADVSDDRTARERRFTTEDDSFRYPLETVVVRYEDRSDRCTLLPKDCSDDEKLTTWLTASVEAFVDLDDTR
ncbi:hypothetical protein ACFOZ7_10205 [Natribaculum luteum]|uniref:DUF7511 domain-containing protein n=1 Tax=Natribaculum luteum TaxID=1586232 RepID=A0ABD5NZ48_9EURY|nr:hypothetical protein [Natribaculum luteum]